MGPIYIPRKLNTGTCIQQGDLFYFAGLHRNHVLATANTGEIGRGFGKNAGEWTGRVERSEEEIHGSKCSSVWPYTDLLQTLKGERLSSVFSPDGTLISASAAPHCGKRIRRRRIGHNCLSAHKSIAVSHSLPVGHLPNCHAKNVGYIIHSLLLCPLSCM